jgi:endogenous inhibitor of DNA gyrase (YacG/DUF329 family)
VSARSRGPQGTSSGKTAKGPARRPKCPICGKSRSEEFRPFCSKHCADIDLGRWLEGRYAVPGVPAGKDEGEPDDDR